MKRVEIIPIAQRKASRRHIPKEWILETLQSPLQVVKGYGGRKVAHRKYFVGDKEYLLRVAYKENSDEN
ncbi:MAG TPA: hypothetical protein VJL89_05360 [Thermodesulfovibrionia bacterium]|nr:hypothetical protein [Thermodesulfovibrionia bacterium]